MFIYSYVLYLLSKGMFIDRNHNEQIVKLFLKDEINRQNKKG